MDKLAQQNFEQKKKKREERKKKLLELLGGKCISCGSRKNLQFDHIKRKKKKFHISDGLDRNEADLMNEVKKCQLLCLDCHRKKTLKSWDFTVPRARCGTIWMYKKYKCRCDKCKKAMSDWYYAKGRKP